MTPNARQRRNLLKLAEYLETLPKGYKHFEMLDYAQHEGDCELPMSPDVYAAKDPKAFLTNCGTAACAVGHGPAAGIKPSAGEFADGDFRWFRYVVRAFGVEGGSDEFDYLFDSDWASIDNHHYGAAARIRHFLATGFTDNPHFVSLSKYASYRKGSRSQIRRAIDARMTTTHSLEG